MKIVYKTGNLLDASETFIVHGCNAQGVMGSGVAKAIRERYPKAYDAYRARYLKHGLHLGETVWAYCSPHVVVNAITQDNYGNDGQRYVDYDALRTAMNDIERQLEDTIVNIDEPFPAIAMPLIGATRGGGKWSEIAPIIETCFVMIQPVVYTLDGVVPHD